MSLKSNSTKLSISEISMQGNFMEQREKSVASGERKVQRMSGRSLKFPGLKPSDFYLLTQEKEYFSFDMRELVVLGLRLIYSGWHRSDIREMIVHLASEIAQEDLNVQGTRIEYKKFREIRTEKEA